VARVVVRGFFEAWALRNSRSVRRSFDAEANR